MSHRFEVQIEHPTSPEHTVGIWVAGDWQYVEAHEEVYMEAMRDQIHSLIDNAIPMTVWTDFLRERMDAVETLLSEALDALLEDEEDEEVIENISQVFNGAVPWKTVMAEYESYRDGLGRGVVDGS